MKVFHIFISIKKVIWEAAVKKNIGSTDRILRIIVGLVLIAFGFYYQTWWGAIGIIPLATALINWCPAYVPFGISTCKTEETKD